ncbi:hypothetical protein ACFL0F_00865 [Patescibacteria group bacterium]
MKIKKIWKGLELTEKVSVVMLLLLLFVLPLAATVALKPVITSPRAIYLETVPTQTPCPVLEEKEKCVEVIPDCAYGRLCCPVLVCPEIPESEIPSSSL